MWSDLEKVYGEIRLESRLTVPMARALVRLLRETEEAPVDPCRQKTILDGAGQFSQVRRDGPKSERVRMRDADWKPPRKPQGCGKAKGRHARPRPHRNPLPQDRELTEAGPDESRDLLGRRSICPNQGQSNQIKPNQTKSNLLGWGRDKDELWIMKEEAAN
jgi:hypothetical protein